MLFAVEMAWAKGARAALMEVMASAVEATASAVVIVVLTGATGAAAGVMA